VGNVSGRRNPMERNTLIRHDNAPSPPPYSGMPQRRSEAVNRSSAASITSDTSTLSNDNQNFLKEVIDGVMTGETVGWLKLNRLKKLLEDESYRNFLISRLNLNLGKQMSDEQYIEDVVSTFALHNQLADRQRKILSEKIKKKLKKIS
jgi:hypothetical protein